MENQSIYEALIGSGVLFPIILTENSRGEKGWYPVKGDLKLIENNLEAVFLHQIGTKFREEDFGSRVWECLEEQNTQAQSFIINQFMREAFENWESRITYKGTKIQRESSKINLIFTYVLTDTNSSRDGILTYDIENK